MLSVLIEHAATTSVPLSNVSGEAGTAAEQQIGQFEWRLYVRYMAAVGVIAVVFAPLVPETIAWAAKQPRGSAAVRLLVKQYRCLGATNQAAEFKKLVAAAQNIDAESTPERKEGETDEEYASAAQKVCFLFMMMTMRMLVFAFGSLPLDMRMLVKKRVDAAAAAAAAAAALRLW